MSTPRKVVIVGAGVAGAILARRLAERMTASLGQTVRSAGYLYAALETFHVLGIGLLIGSIFAIDLRLLGVGRQSVSVTSAMRHLLPVSYVGFITAFITGVALLSAQATMIAASGAAPWKFWLLVAAGANALAFHFGAGHNGQVFFQIGRRNGLGIFAGLFERWLRHGSSATEAKTNEQYMFYVHGCFH